MAVRPSEEGASRVRKPTFRLIPSRQQVLMICGHASELVRQARMYLTVEGQDRAGPEMPEHLKSMGLTALTYTAEKLEFLLSSEDKADDVCSLDTMIALEWLHSIFYGLLQQWGWIGNWKWGEQRDAGVPYVLLPIRWTSQLARAEDLAALEKCVALLLSDPAIAPTTAPPPRPAVVPTQGTSLATPRIAAALAEAMRMQPTTPPLILRSPHEEPIVRGTVKPLLSKGQYDVVNALWAARPDGLTLPELGERSGHVTTAVKILRSLMSDEDWASVIIFPKGGRRGGYRLAME